MDEKSDSLVTDDLSDKSPVFNVTSSRLQMFVDSDWPQPMICNAETEKADKKAKRRIKKKSEEIARDNLVTIFKLVSKELMDSSLVHGRLLDDEFVPLQQLFTVLEHIFLNGLKVKKLSQIKSMLGGNKDFYSILEQVQKTCTEAAELSNTVKEASNIKTQLGKARAWIRLAMMQKKLADYFHILISNKDMLREFYEAGAVLLEEDAHILQGLMVGLNCIDCHLSIRDNLHLDDPVGSIDYSLYLSEASLPGPDIDVTECDSGAADLTVALDQNRFLEEHNTHLTSTLNDIKHKLQTLQESHDCLVKEHESTQKLLKDIQTENDLYRTENNRLTSEFDRKLQVTQDDVDVERETYQATREGLEQMYSESQKRLKEEIRTRQELEKEVQLQISLRAETEMATRLLEKDVHEKQDLIIALRNQLDDVKGYNIEMHSKHQLLESKHKEKMTETKKLEEIIQAIKIEKEKVNNRLKQAVSDKDATEEAIKSISDQLTESDLKRNALETDLRIEKDWRTTTQENLEKSGDKINSLTKQIDRLTVVEQDYKNLKQAHEELTRIHKDQETALAEMAAQLGHSKMKHEDLREVQQALKDAHWADDDLVTECKSCEKSFNLSRRKHHCRNCGDIFCNECSDHRMMLPSSSKPVRVCDNCNLMLIDRASKA